MAIFALLSACNAIWQKKYTASEAAELPQTVAAALALVEQHLPASEQDTKLHNLKHLAQQVERLGPNWVVACWFFEQLYGRITKYIGNAAYFTANIASGHRATAAAVFGHVSPQATVATALTDTP